MSQNIIKNIFKGGFLYAILSIVQSGINFVVLPFYTAVVPAEDYGALMLLISVVSFSNLLIYAPIGSGITRYFYRDEFREDTRKLVFTPFIYLTLCSFISFIVIWVSASQIAHHALGTIEYTFLVRVFSFYILLSPVSRLMVDLMRNRQKIKQLLVINIIASIFSVSVSLVALYVFEVGVVGIAFGMLVQVSLLFLSILIINKGTFKLKKEGVSKRTLKTVLFFGFPLIFSSLGLIITEISDRYILAHFWGNEEVGVYVLSYKVSTILTVLLTLPFQQVINPILNQVEKESELLKSTVYRVSRYYILIATSLALFFSLYASEIVTTMSGAVEFERGYTIVPILALGYVLYGLRDLAMKGLYFANKTKLISVLYLVMGLINLGLNYLWIPKYGINGAAIATLVSYFCIVVAGMVSSFHYYQLTFPIKKIVMIIAVMSGGYVLIGFGEQSFFFSGSINKALLFLVFQVLVFLSPLVLAKERTLILKKVRQVLFFFNKRE